MQTKQPKAPLKIKRDVASLGTQTSPVKYNANMDIDFDLDGAPDKQVAEDEELGKSKSESAIKKAMVEAMKA